MDLPWNGQNSRECLFDDSVEAILLLLLHLTADLLVLVLAVWCLCEVRSEALHALARKIVQLLCAELVLWL